MIHGDEVKRRVERFPALCRQAGLKVTPQRTAVYAMLAGTDAHPTPEAIYSTVRRNLPNVSLATVYKILDQLSAHGLVIKVATSDQAARYDAHTAGHQHTVCSRCGKIEDQELAELTRAVNQSAPPVGFQVSRVDVVIHGLCAECAAGASASA
jgi:Fur family peroxide stress response transcriptional regulator